MDLWYFGLLSLRLASRRYCWRSITTIFDPLSDGLMNMLGLWISWLRAPRSSEDMLWGDGSGVGPVCLF